MRASKKTETVVGRLEQANAAESATYEDEQRRAARVVAGRGANVDDCRELLAMLGLSAAARLPLSAVAAVASTDAAVPDLAGHGAE